MIGEEHESDIELTKDHITPSWTSYRVHVAKVLEKFDLRYNGTA